MIMRSGLGEAIDVATHVRKPIDPIEHSQWITQDLGELFAAQAAVWLLGNEALIAGASEVVEAARVVTDKAIALSEEQKAQLSGGLARFRPLKKDPRIEAELREAQLELGHVCRRFGETMRRELRVKDVGALLRSFPSPSATSTATT